jgi:hypothetical protein
MTSTDGSSGYAFPGGYPTQETTQRAYDEADLNRAILAYRFFCPSVSIMGTWKGNLAAGAIPNRVFALLEGTPEQLVFTPNSDTPYAGLLLDLSDGPMVVDIPPGPVMSAVNDLNQPRALGRSRCGFGPTAERPWGQPRVCRGPINQ